MVNQTRGSLSRRQLLATGGAGIVTLTGGIGMPAISRAADRPRLTHGLQSGDVANDTAIVWARADKPSRALIEVATTEGFKNIRQSVFVDVLPETDFTAKVQLQSLPAGQALFYRVTLQDLFEPTIKSEPSIGSFRTAPADRRSVSFCWSGDTAGQGWGIDESRGGMGIYSAILKNRPDFFIHSGDTIYADGPIAAEQKMPNGEIWRNLVTEEVSKPAESLAEFRGRHKYNRLDRNLLAMSSAIPILAQWDDHDVFSNWWPGEPMLDRAELIRKQYTDPNAMILAARASRAFHEYMPMRFEPAEPDRVYRRVSYGPLLDVFMLDMRSYRGPNGENKQTEYGPDAYFLGPAQIAWLKRELLNSRATWKVIAADMPLGLIVTYDAERKFGSEAVAQGNGPPLGRELEIADLLRFLKHTSVKNTIWLTADVHYTAAHYYDPNKAQFQDFEPFWEFVSGPLHAGTFGPNELDDTFGPQLRFIKAPSKEQGRNLPPSMGYQFFGHVGIDGGTEQMTVTLKDAADADLWRVTLDPALG